MKLADQNIKHIIATQVCVVLASVFAVLFLSVFQYNTSITTELKHFNRELRALKNTINLVCLEVDQDFKDKLEERQLHTLLERYESIFSIQRKIYEKGDYKIFFIKSNQEILEAFSKENFSITHKDLKELLSNRFKWGVTAKEDVLYIMKKVKDKWDGSLSAICIQFMRPNLMRAPPTNSLLTLDHKDNYELLSPIDFRTYLIMNSKDILICFLLCLAGSFVVANSVFLYMRRSGFKKLRAQEVLNGDLNQEISEISDSYYSLLQTESFYREKYINDLKQEIVFFPESKQLYAEINGSPRSLIATSVIEPSVFDITNQKVESITSLIQELDNALKWQAKRKGTTLNFVLDKNPYLFESSLKYIQAIIYLYLDALLKDFENLKQITIVIQMKEGALNISVSSNGQPRANTSVTDLIELLKHHGVGVTEKSTRNNYCIELVVENKSIDDTRINGTSTKDKEDKRDFGNSNIVKFPKK